MSEKNNEALKKAIARKAERRLKARKEKDRGVWFGLGMFGLVGWSVALPSVAGLAVGLWIDALTASRYSWALMGLITGVIIGCIGAWRWVKRESQDE